MSARKKKKVFVQKVPSKELKILLEEAYLAMYYRPVAVAIIVNDKNEVLLVRSAKNPRAWYFPQGGVEIGESVVRGLFREMKEELGLGRDKLKVRGYLGVDDLDAEAGRSDKRGFQRGKRYFFFQTAYVGRKKKIKIDNKEIVGYCWIKVKEISANLSSVRKEKRKILLKYLRMLQ